MNRRHGGRFASAKGVAVAVLAFAACLDRPVETSPPDEKSTFTTTIRNQVVDKIDLLFMIDNSSSMGDKQALLAAAIPDMITRLVTPNSPPPCRPIRPRSSAPSSAARARRTSSTLRPSPGCRTSCFRPTRTTPTARRRTRSRTATGSRSPVPTRTTTTSRAPTRTCSSPRARARPAAPRAPGTCAIQSTVASTTRPTRTCSSHASFRSSTLRRASASQRIARCLSTRRLATARRATSTRTHPCARKTRVANTRRRRSTAKRTLACASSRWPARWATTASSRASAPSIHPSPVGGPTDPLFGYRPAVNTIVNRLIADLWVQCLPEKLPQDSQGRVPGYC